MANASSTGFGFQSVMTLGNTPSTQGLSEYVLKSGTAKRINQNDPCSKQGTGGDDGYLQDAAHTTMADGVTGGAGWDRGAATIQALTGVFNGAFYVNSTTRNLKKRLKMIEILSVQGMTVHDYGK